MTRFKYSWKASKIQSNSHNTFRKSCISCYTLQARNQRELWSRCWHGVIRTPRSRRSRLFADVIAIGRPGARLRKRKRRWCEWKWGNRAKQPRSSWELQHAFVRDRRQPCTNEIAFRTTFQRLPVSRKQAFALLFSQRLYLATDFRQTQ